jgi:hypothetical protein
MLSSPFGAPVKIKDSSRCVNDRTRLQSLGSQRGYAIEPSYPKGVRCFRPNAQRDERAFNLLCKFRDAAGSIPIGTLVPIGIVTLPEVS